MCRWVVRVGEGAPFPYIEKMSETLYRFTQIKQVPAISLLSVKVSGYSITVMAAKRNLSILQLLSCTCSIFYFERDAQKLIMLTLGLYFRDG
jgi:hypothetical protein